MAARAGAKKITRALWRAPRWPAGRAKFMDIITNNFRRAHLYAFFAVAAVGTALTFWAVMQMSPGDWNDSRGPHPYRATLLAVCGPFAGAILRPFEPYSLTIAFWLLPYCAACLIWGVFFQLVWLPFRRGAQGLRMVMGVGGLVGWFAGSVLSIIYQMD
jgi:hypothetical protein